ncbi:MAG: hypothetical protein KC910_04885 [Candidatus Eremiobacteraeota bacterium]|nr:hypothetical protein [Candidatus Eremiobacteraeota bacterium]
MFPWAERIEQYFAIHDCRGLAHDGLVRELIPNWLRQGRSFVDQLDNYAYGNTPPLVAARMLLRAGLEGRFLDLGCGCGGVVLLAASTGLPAGGIDINPAVLRLAEQAAGELSLEAEFKLGDLAGVETGGVQLAYSTATRFTPQLMGDLARLFEQAKAGFRLVTVSQPLPGVAPVDRWSERFSWGTPGEEDEYPFFLHERS